MFYELARFCGRFEIKCFLEQNEFKIGSSSKIKSRRDDAFFLERERRKKEKEDDDIGEGVKKKVFCSPLGITLVLSTS